MEKPQNLDSTETLIHERMMSQHRSTVEEMQRLVDRAMLVLKVDRGWVKIYTVLAKHNEMGALSLFYAEFGAANTLEQQADVLAEWGEAI